MKYLILLMLCGWMASCSVTRPTTTFVIEKEVKAVMDSVAVADTTASIVVYNVNVIVPEQPKDGMSNENQRLIISELGALISTIVALFIVDQNNDP